MNDELVTYPRENDILFTRSIKAGKRIYYLDVKANNTGELFLAITESKRVLRKIHTWYERRHGIHQKCYGHKIKKKVTTLTSQPSSSLKYIKNKKEDRLILFQNKQDKYQ